MQGNWPCFLYPALAILAADAFGTDPAGAAGVRVWPCRWRRCVLLLAYAQALDRLSAAAQAIPWRGFWAWALRDRRRQVVAGMATGTGAGAVLTTDYETTAWLRFYAARPQGDRRWTNLNRYPDAPCRRRLAQARCSIWRTRRRTRIGLVRRDFGIGLPSRADLVRQRQWPARSARYEVWQLAGCRKSPIQGKMP